VHKFATQFADSKQPLHCLVNNAGEFVPKDEVTEDGFEITVGTNHFGASSCELNMTASFRNSSSQACCCVAVSTIYLK
jgi:NAD(P)-dependent dehydrogenase (short-subunit alcohol dehydrogenase family)